MVAVAAAVVVVAIVAVVVVVVVTWLRQLSGNRYPFLGTFRRCLNKRNW